MSNTTIVTASNSSISYNHSQGNVSTHGLNADTANNLGYGIGRALSLAFDSLWNTWHKMWISEPSAIETAEQRNYLIYKGGLRECVKILGPALANLQMNPRDSNALKKVEQLAEHFARYLKPSDEKNLRQLQNEILKPLEERVSAIAFPNMKNVLRKRMAIFFQGNNLMSENEQIVLTHSPTYTPTHVPTSLPSTNPLRKYVTNSWLRLCHINPLSLAIVLLWPPHSERSRFDLALPRSALCNIFA